MSIQVENYLKKLEDEIDNRRTFHDGSTMLFADNLKRKEFFPGFSKNQNEIATLPSGLRLYLKRFYCDDIFSKECITNEIVFSRLYNALGVNAVKYYPLILSSNVAVESFGRDVASASQDLNTVKGLFCESFNTQRDFYHYIGKYSLKLKQLLEHQDELYSISKDKERSRDLLLSFIKTGFLDIICMMVDNHLGNKKVVRKPKCAVAEDIISYDMEDSYIDLFNNSTYADFIHELTYSQDAFRGMIRIDGRTYMGYLHKMRSMRDDGVLPPECVELFEKIVKLNFDELLLNTQNETGLLIPEYKKDFFRKLIDINQEVFSR